MSGMRGKVVVLTGGTSGIGEAAALKLAEMGARLVLVARDAVRAEATIKRLQKKSPGIGHTVHLADLSLIAETQRVAREIAAAEPRIDVLINNAGLISAERQVTAEGLELTFATNHLAYFVLTQGLLERLAASAPARIVNTASEVHRSAKLDFDDLQSEHGYSGFGAYAKSKLANVLFTSELARRLSGSGVAASSLHPGVVASRFGQPRAGNGGGRGGDPSLVRFLSSNGVPPEEGAETIVYLVSAADAAKANGRYFIQCRPATPSKEVQVGLWLRNSGRNRNGWRDRKQNEGVRLGGP